MKTIIERVKAPETKVGKFLVYIFGVLVLVISAVGQFVEYLGLIPHDWIPPQVKTAIVVCSLVSLVIGKLTKDPNYQKPPVRQSDAS
jgi:hypothetical protein